MTLVLETGAGVRNANAYASISFVTTYLTERNRVTENSWSTISTTLQAAAIVAATDYIEKRWAAKFGGQRQFTFTPVSASATLTLSGLPVAAETIVIGSETYTFRSALTGVENEILIGATAAATATNIAAAVNATTGDDGTLYGTGTSVSRDAVASVESAVVTLTSLAPGEAGNDTTLSGTVTNVTIAAFSGGKDGGSQPLSFPRLYLYDRAGNAVLGIPKGLKQATAEYAVRAAAAKLAPDLTTDASGGSVRRKLEQIGPLVEETEYVDGSFLSRLLVPYPEADKLISQYLTGSGREVIR